MRAGLILGGALMLMAGCAPPPPPPPGDPRVFLTPDSGVLADIPIVVPGRLLKGSLRLVNPTAADRPVIATTDWMNASGMPVRTLFSTPQRLTVPRYGDATIELLAPSPAAIQFRVRVEPDLSGS